MSSFFVLFLFKIQSKKRNIAYVNESHARRISALASRDIESLGFCIVVVRESLSCKGKFCVHFGLTDTDFAFLFWGKLPCVNFILEQILYCSWWRNLVTFLIFLRNFSHLNLFITEGSPLSFLSQFHYL